MACVQTKGAHYSPFQNDAISNAEMQLIGFLCYH